MDVMHPSANMRPTPAPVKGQGMTITPPTMQAAVTPDDEPTPADDSPTLSIETSTESMTPIEIPATSQGDQVSPTIGDDSSPSPEAVKLADLTNEPSSSEDPLSSPFLADAKVEKRPLGSAAPLVEPLLGDGDAEGTTSVDATPPPAPEAAKAEDTQEAPSQPQPEPVPLPDELKDDIVAVEANEVVHDDVVPEAPAEDVPQVSAVPDVSTVGSGSIVQQYEEQPSTGDLTNGAIYDTSTYHQPLETHPAKKKSSALVWVLWIVVLLIVGATAGAAWFYFTTQ